MPDQFPIPDPILPPKATPPLPYPYKVGPVPAMTAHAPNLAERLWANRLNLVRHFIIGGAVAAGTAYSTTKNMTSTGLAFIGGGLVEMLRKGGDDELRAAGKPDMLTAILKPKQNGGVMSTRTDVEEVGTALYNLTMAVMSKDEDKAGAILTATLATIKEGADLVDIPKDDIPEAVAHALSMAASKAIAAKVVYTDEKPIAPTA